MPDRVIRGRVSAPLPDMAWLKDKMARASACWEYLNRCYSNPGRTSGATTGARIPMTECDFARLSHEFIRRKESGPGAPRGSRISIPCQGYLPVSTNELKLRLPVIIFRRRRFRLNPITGGKVFTELEMEAIRERPADQVFFFLRASDDPGIQLTWRLWDGQAPSG